MTNGQSPPASIDSQTMEFYARHHEDYLDRIALSRIELDDHMKKFVGELPPGDGPILDWGAGAGESASLLAGIGLTVEATDASPEMAAIARELGLEIRVEPFEALAPSPRYRGIISNVSICHAPRDVVPALVELAASAILDGGVLFLNMKHGTGDRRDSVGRYFSYWTEEDLDAITSRAGLDTVFSETFDSISFTEKSELNVVHFSRKRIG